MPRAFKRENTVVVLDHWIKIVALINPTSISNKKICYEKEICPVRQYELQKLRFMYSCVRYL